MNVPRLPAAVAIRPRQRRAAIEAEAARPLAMRLARPRFELAGDDAAGQRIANPFDTPRIHARMMAEARGGVEGFAASAMTVIPAKAGISAGVRKVGRALHEPNCLSSTRSRPSPG
jgi:hypothetical protein